MKYYQLQQVLELLENDLYAKNDKDEYHLFKALYEGLKDAQKCVENSDPNDEISILLDYTPTPLERAAQQCCNNNCIRYVSGTCPFIHKAECPLIMAVMIEEERD